MFLSLQGTQEESLHQMSITTGVSEAWERTLMETEDTSHFQPSDSKMQKEQVVFMTHVTRQAHIRHTLTQRYSDFPDIQRSIGNFRFTNHRPFYQSQRTRKAPFPAASVGMRKKAVRLYEFLNFANHHDWLSLLFVQKNL